MDARRHVPKRRQDCNKEMGTQRGDNTPATRQDPNKTTRHESKTPTRRQDPDKKTNPRGDKTSTTRQDPDEVTRPQRDSKPPITR